MKYYIKTFGCQQNLSDSERVQSALEGRGMKPAKGYSDADYVVINTCMIRESAENRVYGLVDKLKDIKSKKPGYKIVVTGCMVGVAFRDKSGKFLQKIKKAMPAVDEFMPIEEVGFDFAPIRTSDTSAWVAISNGCNNFCTFCIVPFTRGREISRPYQDIIDECKDLRDRGYTTVTLLGQNVNSYGADLILGENNIQVMRDLPEKTYFDGVESTSASTLGADSKIVGKITINGKKVTPTYVTHLGRMRIPTLFPNLLQDVAKMGFDHVDFVSSNPWDFSDELIKVIADNKNISRTLHLPVQSGDSAMLKRMNRWYTREQYLNLVSKIKKAVPDIKLTTDIIVGFCGESEREFNSTVELCKEVGFYKAYISIYSPRPMTASTKVLEDDVPHPEKKRRWKVLDTLVNTPNVADFKASPQHMHKASSYGTQ